jgi:uncharacterized protein
MNYATLQNIINKLFTYCLDNGSQSISIIWHGGEPLLQSLDFYRYAIDLQNGFKLKTYNYIQTNGTLLNENWALFFKDSQFKIGISMDGPEALNDQNRTYTNCEGSFKHIMQGIDVLRSHDIPVGVLVVISKTNVHYLSEIYDYLKINSFDAKINPLIKAGRATRQIDNLRINPKIWANNRIKLAKIWLTDSKPIHLDCLENCMINYYSQGSNPGECHFKVSCQDEFLAIDYSGDVYPCGEFCGSHEYKYGNINNDSMDKILISPLRLKLLQRNTKLSCCDSCSYYSICYGGCMFKALAWKGTVYASDFSCEFYKSFYTILDSMNDRIHQFKKPIMRKEVT